MFKSRRISTYVWIIKRRSWFLWSIKGSCWKQCPSSFKIEVGRDSKVSVIILRFICFTNKFVCWRKTFPVFLQIKLTSSDAKIKPPRVVSSINFDLNLLWRSSKISQQKLQWIFDFTIRISQLLLQYISLLLLRIQNSFYSSHAVRPCVLYSYISMSFPFIN